MRSQYSLDEQETTINVFPKAVSEHASIYTCIPSMVQRIKKLYESYPDDVTFVEYAGGVQASVPRGWIKIQPKRKCTLTEEQKLANAARLATMRKGKAEVVQT